MRTTKKTLLKTGAVPAAAALLTLAMPAAFAASSYNVSAGTATGSVAWTATTLGTSPQIKFTDVDAGVTLNCSSGGASGTAKVGSGLSGAGIGSIGSTAWNTCTGPGGISLSVTGHHPWTLNATGDTVGGVTPGTITGINADVSSSSCSFNVTGSVDVAWNNNAGSPQLDVPGNTATLTINNPSFGCSLLGIANGDQATFDATYAVSSTNASHNPIALTSNP